MYGGHPCNGFYSDVPGFVSAAVFLAAIPVILPAAAAAIGQVQLGVVSVGPGLYLYIILVAVVILVRNIYGILSSNPASF